MTSTEAGEATPELSGALTESEATDAFMSKWKVTDEGTEDTSGKKPSETEDKPTTEEPTDGEETETETSDESPEGEEEEPVAKKYTDDDETYVKIKEGDTEHEVSVKDLKRLFGQEAALTRKSQEVAEARKKADADTAKALSGLNAMLQRAQERAKPYKEIDFLVASKTLEADELSALRQEAQRVMDDEKFLTSELDGFVKQVSEQKQAERATQAQACVASLKDAASPNHIPGWGDEGDKVYNDLRTFAKKQGVAANVIDNLIDPAAIKIVHMAMQFAKAKEQSTTTKVNKQPKKIVKSSKTLTPTKGSVGEQKKAMDNLRDKQTTDAAAEAFLARWKDSDQD